MVTPFAGHMKAKDYEDPKRFKLVPLETIKTPKDGHMCVCNRYWAVHRGKVLFFRGRTPQMNHDPDVLTAIHPECQTVFVEVAYVEHRCSDYV